MRTFAHTLLFCLIFGLAAVAGAQENCVTETEVKALADGMATRKFTEFNKPLSKELQKLAQKNSSLYIAAIDDPGGKKAQQLQSIRPENDKILCRVLKSTGWPNEVLLGEDGLTAWLYLFRRLDSLKLQIALMPLVAKAADLKEIYGREYADLLDRVRIRAGLKQLFGTQTTVANGFLVLQPIDDEKRADELRAKYGMDPLATDLRKLERRTQMPLIRKPTPREPPEAKVSPAEAANILETNESQADEVIRVESQLVNINVAVFDKKLKGYLSGLEQKDFQIFENGQQMEVGFFGSTKVPFDMVLLLDLSGSTSTKRDLIKKGARRFVEAARPGDRIGIFTFSTGITRVSGLTDNRAELVEKINAIEGVGASNIWDAVNYGLDYLGENTDKNRRRAIVLLSDGIDGSDNPTGGSMVSFADLLENARRSDVIMNTIYIDNFGSNDGSWLGRIYEKASKSMSLLASETGGLFYKADSLKDLEGVYQKVIDDLGQVYSLGYTPASEGHDGEWRAITVKLPNHPNHVARSRSGYFAQ